MPNTLQIKRGLQINLPTGLAGELLYTSDTKRLYIGDGATNNLLQGASSILTTGMVSFSDSSGKLTGSSSLYWDNTNGRLGIGGTPSETLDVKGNATSGFNAISFKSQYTSVGYLGGDNTSIFFSTAPSSGGSYLSLSGSNANLNGVQNIRFLTGSTERARIASTTGNVLINTTTDAGFKLDVNGTARVQGNTTITSADVANPDVGPPAFNIFNGTFSKFNVVYNAASCRVNMLGTSTQGLRIDTGSSTNFSTIGGGGLTFSCSTNNFQIISASVLFNVAGAERARFAPSTGNLLINTTTDAGFKLDVNGTARVLGRLTLGNAGTAGELYSNPSVGMNFASGSVTDVFTFTQMNNGVFNTLGATEQSMLRLNIGQATAAGGSSLGSVIRMIGNVTNSSLTSVYNNIQTNTVINTSGGTTTYRGFYHNPTLTATVGVTHYAFHSTSGRIRFENLPTSPTGLSTGEVWNNLGILTIV